MVEKDSFDHVVKTTAQWESQSFEYWIIPRGVLCVELTPDKKTKIKIGEGNKIYSQLPYINSETDLSDYYTKEEIDNILAMLNFVAIPSSEIYPTKESLPQTGNRQGDLRFVLNTTGDPYEYLWFDNKWISLGGDLSEYAKKSEVNPRLNALELKAHTHVNKNVLDRLTANVIDDSHKHANKNILDATTASYTTQDKATLDELAAITIFEGATKTEDGTMGYVPAPLQGQHTYFLKGDGTWAYLDPGDKYKAGEGIYILSGEVTTQTFPFKLYAKGGYVKQYIIYGAPGGVGEWNATTQTYHIPIRVSAEGHTSIDTVIQVRDKLYEGDWINFETQEYSVYRTNLTSQFQNLIAIEEMSGIDTAGNFNKPPGYWPQFALSDYYEIDPDAKYEIPELDDWSYEYANVNMYDADKNRTRTILRSRTSKVQIIPLLGEKYIRIAGWVTIDHGHGGLHSFRDPLIYQLKDTISPVPSPLQQIQLIPNAINTIDVLTTNKPLDVYMETYIPEEPDPEDPLSGYSGIIYNDGVLDITQEDPNNLNELTVHFRENVEKTLTIPSASVMEGATPTTDGEEGLVPAPLAGDQGKFLRGDGTWEEVPKDKYKAGEGIYILSGEVTADSFPFDVYAKGGYLKQYIIYGAPGGVGDWDSSTGKYHIPIRVSAEGHTSIETIIQIDQQLFENDWINFELQEYSVYRTILRNDLEAIRLDNYSSITTSGSISNVPGSWGAQFGLTDYYEIDPDAIYEMPPESRAVYNYANVNMYDANKNRTRTILRSQTAAVQIIPQPGEKYLRIAAAVGIFSPNTFVSPVLTRLADTIFPVTIPLQQINLIPNAINTIDVLTTVKPLDMYVETFIPPDPDPDDPMSEYSGIIYNDGVLDITQEDPNALNELTVHFRENVEKTLTIPSTPLPIATDSTLGGIIVGNNLTIDEDGVLDATGGDKYRAGEGIYILSGEVISDTFPFEIFPKTSRTSQYIIYGSEEGVGDWDGTNITLSITTSAPGETTLTTQILYNAKLYSGDYLDYSRQIIHHSKQDMRQYVSLYDHPSYGTSGIFQTNTGSVIANYNAYTGITDYIEVNPGEVYMVQAFVPYDTYDTYFTTFHCIFDENYTLTRYFRAQDAGVITIEIQPGEKYARFVGTPTTKMLQPGFLYKLEPYEEPCVLPSIILYANKVNTINVSNTNKPSEIYFEAASDGSVDPEDPTSEFTGIIYNEGVLDVTQEDPTALNELTFHFRDNVDKTLTIPSAPLPIASDTTLGGIKVGNNLTIDPVTGVLDATGGNSYVEGQGIEFSRPILETYQVLDKIRKPSGTTLTTDVMPSGTVDFFCDLKYYKYAGGTSFLILCYDGERGSFCYTAPVTNSSNSTRMWIYTAHENWYDLYLYDSVQSSNPITVHLRWGTTMSIHFDHTTRSAQNSPGVLPGHNLFRFDSSSDADLYWAKFYENSALVGELVPVIRQSDSAVGMFNKVTETFSTVSGLIAGTPTGETIVVYDPSSTQNIPINAKLGNGLHFDANGAIEADGGGGGTEYVAGDGIQIDEGTSVIDITSIQWQQGKIDDSDGSEAITGVEPYLDCEMFEITSHTSMVTLSGTYDNNIMLLWKPYYYDEHENYISTVNTWSTYEDGVQIPINAKYVRFVLTEDETTILDPNDLAHVEIEYPLEVGKEVITNTGVIDIQVRDRKLIITKHNTIEEIPIPDPPLATTSTPGIVTVGQDLTIDQNGVLNIADINRLILNVEE